MQYAITRNTIDGTSHSIIEIWRRENWPDTEKVLTETLDLVTENGKPVKPSMKRLKAGLGRYVNEAEFLEQELEREKKGYAAYKAIAKLAKAGPGKSVCCELDVNDHILVETFYSSEREDS